VVRTYIGKATDELICISFLTCVLYQLTLLCFRTVFPLGANETTRNIIEDCVIEEEWFLLYQTDLGSPPLDIEVFQVMAAGRDFAR
jgi:hypothetical protein